MYCLNRCLYTDAGAFGLLLEIDFMSIENTQNNTPPQSLIGVRNFNQMNPSSDFKESRETYPSSLPPFEETV